jgi:hypothetical protein
MILKKEMSRENVIEGTKDQIDERSTVKFHEITDVFSEEFEEAMKIYVTSFPINEQRPITIVKEMLVSGKNRLLVGEMTGRTVFMALLFPLQGTPFLLGDYLATAVGYRSCGIGKAFLRYILNEIASTPFKFFLIEIENPYIDNDEMKMRRLRFYQSLGMKELKGVRYLLPPLQGTSSAELILMVFSREEVSSLKGETVRDLIIRMFAQLYGRHNGDEFLMLTLQGVPDLVWLA